MTDLYIFAKKEVRTRPNSVVQMKVSYSSKEPRQLFQTALAPEMQDVNPKKVRLAVSSGQQTRAVSFSTERGPIPKIQPEVSKVCSDIQCRKVEVDLTGCI